MRTVHNLLQVKGNQVWSVTPSETVFEALERMSELDIGALLVMEGGELVGILSERDYARKIALAGKASKETSVEEIMTSRVYCVELDQTVEEAMALMTNRRVRHLPVVGDQKTVIGVISIGDVVKDIIAEKEFHIEQLEKYIAGGR